MICDRVYINGTFFDKDDAKVSVFDHGFVYGDGAFEGIQIVNGVIFLLDEHLERLNRSLQYLEIPFEKSPREVRDVLVQTARENQLRDGYLRPIITRGAGPMGIRNIDMLSQPTFVVVAQRERIEERRARWDQGITAQIVSLRRVSPQSLDSQAKTCNYINNILAYLEARSAGAETAIMLDMDGYVAECYSSNIFVVKNGAVMTPALGSILSGITRAMILTICKKLDIEAREVRLTPYDLFTADEVFESGTLAEVRPLVKINGRLIDAPYDDRVSTRIYHELRGMMESGQHGFSIDLQD